MKTTNISVVGKKLDILCNKFDSYTKVGAVNFTEKDIKSETDLINALQKVADNFANGTYTVHHDESLFARFDIENKQITRLHKKSENTGIIMPCWNYFEK